MGIDLYTYVYVHVYAVTFNVSGGMCCWKQVKIYIPYMYVCIYIFKEKKRAYCAVVLQEVQS